MSEDNNVFLSIEFDGLPPTVNQMYRSIGTRRYKTTACQNFQTRLADHIKLFWGNKPPLTQHVSLYITFDQSDRRRWDIDNRVKSLQDCLQMAGVIKDDSQIDLLHLERRHDAERTITRFSLRALDELKRNTENETDINAR